MTRPGVYHLNIHTTHKHSLQKAMKSMHWWQFCDLQQLRVNLRLIIQLIVYRSTKCNTWLTTDSCTSITALFIGTNFIQRRHWINNNVIFENNINLIGGIASSKMSIFSHWTVTHNSHYGSLYKQYKWNHVCQWFLSRHCLPITNSQGGN